MKVIIFTLGLLGIILSYTILVIMLSKIATRLREI